MEMARSSSESSAATTSMLADEEVPGRADTRTVADVSSPGSVASTAVPPARKLR